FQWGGRHLCEGWRFPTPDGRAHFSDAMPAAAEQRPRRYQLSTRRGKQFNSMVWRERDPLTGAGRDALFLSAVDAIALAVTEGDPLVVRAEGGATVRARAHVVPIRAGNVQMFWPEANALIAQGRRDAVSGVPDYNAVVEISRGSAGPRASCSLAVPRDGLVGRRSSSRSTARRSFTGRSVRSSTHATTS